VISNKTRHTVYKNDDIKGYFFLNSQGKRIIYLPKRVQFLFYCENNICQGFELFPLSNENYYNQMKTCGAILNATMNLFITDIYTVARMLKTFSNGKYPYNIIYYGGNDHTINIGRILTRLGAVKTSFDVFEMGNKCIVDIKRFTYFSDMFKR
jgi:hypothetical protein